MAAEVIEEAKKTFLLKSSDGLEFVVSDLEASQSMTIQRKIEFMLSYQKRYGVEEDSAIHLAVKSDILSKVIDYFKKQLGSHGSGGDPQWGAKFVDVDHETLCGFIIASDYLRIQVLLELSCHTLANKIKGKSSQEIRRLFNIRNGSTQRATMAMMTTCDFEAHANREVTAEEKTLRALNIVRRQEFTKYDPKLNDFMCTRFCLLNMAFFDLDEESRFGRRRRLHGQPKLFEKECINVISLKICESDVGFPINLFGTVIARDEVDYKCVYMFRREVNDPQFITSPDDMLALTDPRRGLIASDKIYFEINLKIKTDSGAIKDFSKGVFIFESEYDEVESYKTICLTSWLSEVELAYAHVLYPVEAIIAINLSKGTYNISRVEAWTTENREAHMVLYDNKAADTQIVINDGGGSVPLTRRVVAVPVDEKVVLSIVVSDEAEPLVLTLGQTNELHACKMGTGEVHVKIAWAGIPKRRKYQKWEYLANQTLLV